jgi:hypothetical protein
MFKLIRASICAAVILASGVVFAQQIEVDARIPAYKKVSGISGNASSIWF